MIFGGDFSSWQGTPDFVGLKGEGIAFAIHKVTGEGDYYSPVAQRNLRATRDAGIIPGSYDWVEPQSGMTGADAAKDYLRTLVALGGHQLGDLLGTDFETPDWATGPLGRTIEPFMRQYVLTLLEEQDLFFYTGPYFLDETGARDWAWLNDPRIHYWEAAPGPQAQLPDDAPWPPTYPPFPTVLLHQHQWHATSRYVAGEFDRNRCQLTVAELAAYGRGGRVVQGGEVQEPPEGKYTAYINERGNPIFVWNVGGTTPRIDGINVQDLGVSVESETEPGVILDRSIQGQEVKPFHDRRQDAGATQRPVGAPGQVR